MAITKVGPPLAGIRGTIAGITYSANGTGTYAKAWAPPVNPKSPKQTTERGFLSQMPSLWNALTPVQQTAWDTFSGNPAQELFNSLGESYFASGWNWFCKCNVRLIRVGRTPLQPVPTQARPASPTINEFRVCDAGSDPDLTPGGAYSADEFLPPNVAANAFDDNTATFWRTNGGAWPHWLQVVLTAPVKIMKFTIQSPNASPSISPKDFTFESFNGLTWDTLLTVTGSPVFGALEVRTWYVPEPAVARTAYRIHVTAADVPGTDAGWVNTEMFTAVNGQSVIIYPQDDFANTPDYDLILHVAPGVSTGKKVQYPGFREILPLQSPPRQAAPFQSQLEAAFGTIQLFRAWFAQLSRQTTQGIRSNAATDRTETI